MRVRRLRVYPVKSFAGLEVSAAAVEPWGLAGDRRWCVVDDTGEVVTAREVNGLLALSAVPAAGGGLTLRDRNGADQAVATPIAADPTRIGLSRQASALPAPDAVNSWLSSRVGTSVRLVWQPDPTVRSIAPKNGGRAGETLSMADAGPLLLVSLASMAQLDEWTGSETEPMDPIRFRPNVVVDGDVPFAEDGWARVRIGEVTFRTTMSCDRCVMTTVDPQTILRGKEPIATLARHRRWDGKVWFGTWLAPEARVTASASGGDAGPTTLGSIAVGDRVVAI